MPTRQDWNLLPALWLGLLVICLPANAQAACGPIPAGYPLSGGSKLKVDKNTSINGNAIAQGDSGADSVIQTDGTRTTVAQTLPDLDPATFPANGSSIKATEADSPFTSTTDVFYDEIKIGKNNSAAFTGGGPFHVNKLELEDNATLNLAAGVYYIDELKLGKNVTVNITSEPVLLHIGKEFKTDGQNVTVNSGGNVDGLVVYLHAGAKFQADDKNLDFTGVVYGPNSGEVKLGENASFRGAIVTSDKIELKKNTTLTYTPADQAAVGAITTCTTGPAIGSFLLGHDGYAIHCLAETVTLTALDTLGGVLTGYAGTVVLDTQSGNGTWSLVGGAGAFSDPTPDDGLAAYTFDPADAGGASFSLSYPSGTPVLDVDAYESAAPGVRDDDSEGSLVFSPSGFTVTANALSNPPPNPINDPIPNQTAGTAFALHLAAYGQTPTDPVCGVIEGYAGVKALKFWSGYDDPASGSVQVSVDAAAVATAEGGAAGQNVTFAAGRAQVTAKYKDVGRILIAMKDDTVADPALATGIRGASNLFVVRPADIQIDQITLAGDRTSLNPAAGGPAGAAFVKAGEAFRVKVRVLDAEGAVTPNYGNESAPEGVRLVSSTLVAPAVGIGGRNASDSLGTIINAGAFGTTDYDGAAMAPGEFVGNTFAWDEVGVIRLTASVADADYLASGDVTGGESGDVGRFYPDHFDVAVTTAAAGAPAFDAGCTSFTYLDQPLRYSAGYAPIVSITARNLAGGTTENYFDFGAGQDWWRLQDRALTYSDAGMPAGVTIDDSAATQTLASGTPTGKGLFSETLTGPLAYQRPAGDAAPFNAAMQVGVDVTEPAGSDGVAYDDGAGSSVFSFSIGFAAGHGSEMRHGRLRSASASGSELLPLAVPLAAEYYDGAAFVPNTADGCTALNLAGHLLLGNPATGAGLAGTTSMTIGAGSTAASLNPGGFAAGDAGLSFSAPGAGNTGYVDVDVDLSDLATAPYWLRYDWSGGAGGHLENPPRTRATFGIYGGSPRIIQIREPWN